MRFILFLITYITFTTFCFAQDDFLAKQYFADGDFEKAVVFYEKLIEKNPRRTELQLCATRTARPGAKELRQSFGHYR